MLTSARATASATRVGMILAGQDQVEIAECRDCGSVGAVLRSRAMHSIEYTVHALAPMAERGAVVSVVVTVIATSKVGKYGAGA